MYFLDINLLILQALPPSWREDLDTQADPVVKKTSGKYFFLISLFTPMRDLLQRFNAFKVQARQQANLSAQTMVIEHHVQQITGLRYGVYIAEKAQSNQFILKVPIQAQTHQTEIHQFLIHILPLGRKYELTFY